MATLRYLSLALAALATLVGVSAEVQCPKGPGPVALSLDLAELWKHFYLGEFTYAQAANSSQCLALASYGQCEGLTSEFYIFSEKGFKDSRGDFLGNCAFGGPCVGLESGALEATVGEVPAASCAKEVFLTELQEPDFVSCPHALESQKMDLDVSNFAEHADQGLVNIVDVWDAAECKKIAEEERCAGQLTGFFVFNGIGFKDAAGLDLGKCALSAACFSLEKGSTAVTAGNVQPECKTVVVIGPTKATSSVALRGELSS